MAMEVWAIVVAAGSGTRFGRLKQLDPLGERRVLDWAIEGLGCRGRTVVVLPSEHLAVEGLKECVVVAGGASRSDSVRAGLAAIPGTATHVLVHDGARPLVSSAIVDRVIQALDSAEGAIPVVAVTDTLRDHDGNTVDRSQLVAVQTPQGFRVPALRQAHAGAAEATDDAGLVTAQGGTVVHVAGDPTNLKITVPSDLSIAEVLINAR